MTIISQIITAVASSVVIRCATIAALCQIKLTLISINRLLCCETMASKLISQTITSVRSSKLTVCPTTVTFCYTDRSLLYISRDNLLGVILSKLQVIIGNFSSSPYFFDGHENVCVPSTRLGFESHSGLFLKMTSSKYRQVVSENHITS